jgi:RNA polymerase sigma-B factor
VTALPERAGLTQTQRPDQPGDHGSGAHLVGARIPDQGRREPDAEVERLEAVLAEFAELPYGPRRARVRDQVITGFLPVARRLAVKYRDRGVPVEDLVQVAAIGLVNAVDRFEPDRGSAFLSYAIPTIQGEIRRYFRDRTWSMRVPRGLQERHLAITRATEVLSLRLGRAPRPSASPSIWS